MQINVLYFPLDHVPDPGPLNCETLDSLSLVLCPDLDILVGSEELRSPDGQGNPFFPFQNQPGTGKGDIDITALGQVFRHAQY